jgi:hypothetical protein
MVRPAAFGWNAETAGTNAFQAQAPGRDGDSRDDAVRQFDRLAAALSDAGVRVHALDQLPGPACPDAVFPNNWCSLHHDGTAVLYPMLAPARRLERRKELLAMLQREGGYRLRRTLDLTSHERAGRFLEGTGSVVFDHHARMAYACRSPRTDDTVLAELCGALGYEPFVFDASDAAGRPIYHTNVMLAIGARTAVVCAESVTGAERGALVERLGAGGRAIVAVDRGQMAAFACNALELTNRAGEPVLALSARAWSAFDAAERGRLEGAVARVVAAEVPTIEALGGGSVRCMLAEVFLPHDC